MAVVTLFSVTLDLGSSQADVTIDVSAGQSYNGNLQSLNAPWHLDIYVDGVANNGRGGAGAVSDVISCMGAVKGLGAGQHLVEVKWFGANTNQSGQNATITLSGAVLRIIATKR